MYYNIIDSYIIILQKQHNFYNDLIMLKRKVEIMLLNSKSSRLEINSIIENIKIINNKILIDDVQIKNTNILIGYFTEENDILLNNVKYHYNELQKIQYIYNTLTNN